MAKQVTMKIINLIMFCMCSVSNGVSTDSLRDGLKLIQAFSELILRAEINEEKCVTQIMDIFNGINDLEEWAYAFPDASAKIQPSLLTGNIDLLGGYDQCMDIDVNKGGEEIRGQYCKTTIKLSSSTTNCINQKMNELEITGIGKTTLDELAAHQNMKYDVCVPAGCSVTSLQKIWNLIEHKFNLTFNVIFAEEFCTTLEKQNTFTVLEIVVICIFSVIALIVILSTVYDIFFFKKRGTLSILTAFSFYSNGKRLFSVKKSKTNISCLNGIRAISLAWIIFGHRTLFNFLSTPINANYAFEWLKHEENMLITGAFASVDTFFLISGFLIVYVQMSIKEKGFKINIFVFYIHRILRLTPALSAILLFHLGVANHLGSGPLWFFVEESVAKSCRENWWYIMLYVQNYLAPSSFCISQTWYLAADTQLYFISPLIVLPLFKWTKCAIAFIIVLLVASNAHLIYNIYYYELDEISYSAIFIYWDNMYLPTHLRITPWLIGILLGYYMFSLKDRKTNINKKCVIFFWISAMALLLIVMYGSIKFVNMKFTLLEVSIFVILSHVLWSIGVSWVIFACERGYGGFINDFLSLPVFGVLARLSYSMFLTHLLVIIVMVSRARTPSYISNFAQFHYFWGDYFFCLLLSAVWTLTFESPITILEKTLIKRAEKDRRVSDGGGRMRTLNNGLKESCD